MTSIDELLLARYQAIGYTRSYDAVQLEMCLIQIRSGTSVGKYSDEVDRTF